MKIDLVEIRRLSLPFKESFRSAVNEEIVKDVFLIEISSGEYVGYGESGTTNNAFYVEETNSSLEYVLENFLIDLLFKTEIHSPWDVSFAFGPIRRNYMAKALVECAIWDLFAKYQRLPLWKVVGGVRDEIEVGISIGLQPNDDVLLEKVASAIDEGYRRVKLKIKPGNDIEPLRRVRQSFPTVPLMVDANCSYTLGDLEVLRQLDDFNLMMIEQPLSYNDLFGHSLLAKEIDTPLCLDESICSIEDLKVALELDACSVVNLKVARVGGLSTSLAIEKMCREGEVGLWCGGLYETGVGRALNLAVGSLEGVNLPGDTSPSSRYFARDIIKESLEFVAPGTIALPKEHGLGVELDKEYIDSRTLYSKVYENPR